MYHVSPVVRLRVNRPSGGPLPSLFYRMRWGGFNRSWRHNAPRSASRRLRSAFSNLASAWSAIHLCRYFIKFFLGVQGQIGAFRKVLPEQPAGVLVGAALPRWVRVAEMPVRIVNSAWRAISLPGPRSRCCAGTREGFPFSESRARRHDRRSDRRESAPAW
jgi:hypothetical protein